MNKLEEFKNNIKGKKIAVLGLGVSNKPAIDYLYNLGADIYAYDKCDNGYRNDNIDIYYGEDYLDKICDAEYILRSPGIKPFIPQIEEKVLNGSILTSEIELLVKFAPCKIIGITGSDGKTTTTTLISEILKQAGYIVHLGGNIGTPLLSKLDEIKKEDYLVLELSSFQLMTFKESIDISVITNISENHLDYHRSFEEYIDAKANIFLDSNLVILNKDNIKYTKYFESLCNDINIRYFSIEDKYSNCVYLKDNNIVTNIDSEKIICSIDKIKLIGTHNIANICAAISAVYSLVEVSDIINCITTFNGVEHRMELFETIDSVKWYNDSIGTSPARTIAGLKSFKDKIILIAGGYDKNISYDDIGKYIVDKVKLLILLGDTANKIERSVLKVDKDFNIVRLNTLEECVAYAKLNSNKNDSIVLSPASASFDLYKNFEERGKHFKELVRR